MRLRRGRDGYCPTHLVTFGPKCTRCESEADRRGVVRELVLAGGISMPEPVAVTPARPCPANPSRSTKERA